MTPTQQSHITIRASDAQLLSAHPTSTKNQPHYTHTHTHLY